MHPRPRAQTLGVSNGSQTKRRRRPLRCGMCCAGKLHKKRCARVGLRRLRVGLLDRVRADVIRECRGYSLLAAGGVGRCLVLIG